MGSKIIKAIIGLGNPGAQFEDTRHNIGFRILDALAEKYGASWKQRDQMEIAEIVLNDQIILLIKPLTFMNNSGKVIHFLQKKGIKPEETLVVHDELEMPFGKLSFKMGGSARGHNGLKSIIAQWGDNFERLRFGIGRPEQRDQVSDYVLQNFSEKPDEIDFAIKKAVHMIEQKIVH